MGSCHTNRVLPHQTPHPSVSDMQAQLVQLFRRSRATIAALAQSVLIADMRQNLGHSFGAMAFMPSTCRALANGIRGGVSKPLGRDPWHLSRGRHAPGKGIYDRRPEMRTSRLLGREELRGFLRNSLCFGHWGKGKSEGIGTTLVVCNDAGSVSLFVGCCTGVVVAHPTAQPVVKQNRDLTSGSSDRPLLADPG